VSLARRSRARAAPLLALALLAASGPACEDACCDLDSRPIPLEHGPAGELLVRLATGGAEPGLALLDTGSPVTLWNTTQPAQPATIQKRDWILLGPPATTTARPVRGVIKGVLTIDTALGAIGTGERSFVPIGVLGGDVLKFFSVEIGFAVPEVTFWPRQPAPDDFLAGAGYAVLHLPRYGGGEIQSLDPPDSIGMRSPHVVQPSRLLVRACAAPAAFDRVDPLPARCCASDEQRLITGTDLSLLLTTGTGPVVLGRAAWERLQARSPTPLALAAGPPLLVASSTSPIAALWTKLPRLALVNREADLGTDPGPCAELARARRLEQVDYLQSLNDKLAACALPCDVDPVTPGRARNAAAYVEVDNALDVAVIADTEALIQGVREEVRPGAPEVDGFLGAAALAGARVELDQAGQDTRALFSCETGAPPASCRAVARCARLPEPGVKRVCFGLPTHALPEMCESQAACGP
jgi:hypothetical protein